MSLLAEFSNYKIVSENTTLTQEQGVARKRGHCIIRALNWFVFIKDGKMVTPVYDACTEEFWEGVEVFGFVASLTGAARYHIMAGLWSYTWGGKHFEVMRIQNVVGLSKERNVHWRGGLETTLWLETQAGYSYALLDPTGDFLPVWKVVTHSWKPVGDGEDPTYRDADLTAKPAWWTISKCYNYAVRQELYGPGAESSDEATDDADGRKGTEEKRKRKGNASSTPKPNPKLKPRAKSKSKSKSKAQSKPKSSIRTSTSGRDSQELCGRKRDANGSVLPRRRSNHFPRMTGVGQQHARPATCPTSPPPRPETLDRSDEPESIAGSADSEIPVVHPPKRARRSVPGDALEIPTTLSTSRSASASAGQIAVDVSTVATDALTTEQDTPAEQAMPSAATGCTTPTILQSGSLVALAETVQVLALDPQRSPPSARTAIQPASVGAPSSARNQRADSPTSGSSGGGEKTKPSTLPPASGVLTGQNRVQPDRAACTAMSLVSEGPGPLHSIEVLERRRSMKPPQALKELTPATRMD